VEEPGEESEDPKATAKPGWLERSAPWICAAPRVAMIVVAAIDYLDASVSIANE
jgi:hypothetical protein